MRCGSIVDMREGVSWTLLLLLALVIVPSIHAVTLDSASLTWNGEPVKYVSPNSIIPSILTLEFTAEESIDKVRVDLSQLNPSKDEYKDKGLDLSLCVKRDSTRKCRVSGVMIKTDNPNPVVHFNFSNSTGWTSLDSSFSLTIDSTKPEVTFIGTKTCADGKCYVGSGIRNKVVIEMQDDVASFSRGLVFFNLGSATSRMVYSCEDTTCFGFAKTSCIDGQNVQVSLSNHPVLGISRDDANNYVVGAISNTLICDGKAPEIDETTITYSSGSGLPTHSIQEEYATELPYINIGDEAIITFNVTDPTTPSLNVTANLSSIGQDDVFQACVKAPGYTKSNPKWSCSIGFTMTPEQPTEVTIPIAVYDLTGHKDSFEAVFEALEPQSDSSISYWSIASDPRPINANKRYLEFSPKKLFMTIKLVGGSKNRILKVEPTNTVCAPLVGADGEAEGSPGDVIDFEITRLGGTTLFVKATMTPGDKYSNYGHSAGYNCSFNIWTKAGDHVVTYPELKWFKVRVNFHNSKTIGEVMKDGIQEAVNKTLKDAEKTAWYRDQLRLVNRICAMPGLLKNTGSTLSVTGGGLASTGYPPVVETGNAIGNTGTAVSKVAEVPFLTQACQFAHCEHDYNKLLTGNLDRFKSLNKVSEWAGLGSNISGTINPHDSIYTAFMTGCVPAIIEHMERKQTISCELIRCLSEDVPTGIPPETCYKTAQYATCVYNWGNVYGLPLVGTVRGIFRDITNIFRDPVTLFSTGGVLLLCKGLPQIGAAAAGKWFCEAEASARGAIDAINNARKIGDQFSELMGTKEVAKSACDTVKDNIDRSTTYWNYPENEGPVLDQRSTVRIGAHDYQMTCNQYNGCKIIGENKVSLTAFPSSTDGSSYKWFIDGKAVPDGLNSWLNNPSEQTVKLDEYNNNYQMLVAGGFVGSTQGVKGYEVVKQKNNAISSVKDNALAFQTNIRKRIEETGDEDLLNSFNNYIRTVNEYYTSIDIYERTARVTRTNYLLVAHYDDNLNDLARLNSRLEKDFVGNSEFYSALESVSPYEADARVALFELYSTGDTSGISSLDHDAIARLPRSVQEVVIDAQNLHNRRVNLKSQISDAYNIVHSTDNKPSDLPDLDSLSESTAKSFIKEEKSKVEELEATLKSEAEQSQEALEKEQESIKKAEDQMRRDLLYAQNWAGAKFIGGTLRWSRAIRTYGPALSNLISKGSAERQSKMVDSLLEKGGTIGEILSGNWEYYQCRDKLGGGDEGAVLAQSASTTFTSQAHVEALRIRNGWGREKNYSYQINAYVKNGNEYTDFDVEIWLRGDGQDHLVNRTHLDSEHPLLDRVQQHFILVEGLTQAYDKVCLHFSKNLNEIFDMTGENPGKEICRRIEIK